MIEHLAYGPHPEQYGELVLPDADQPHDLVILIHGGFWRDRYRLDLMHPVAGELQRRGYATWNIEYRRVGPTGGGYPTTLDDVAAAIDLLADRGWRTVTVVGHSAGGHLALWNAGRAGAELAPLLTVGLAPVADVIAANRKGVGVDATTNFFDGDYDAVPDAYRAAQPQPDRVVGRIVLIHGTNDDAVPLEQSTDLEGRVDRVVVIEGADHFDVIDPAHESWHIVFDELEQLQT